MRMLPAFAFAGAAAAALAGAAVAAAPKTHVMNVSLPNGSVARVEYVGDVAPKVTLAPRAVGDITGMAGWGGPFPSFAAFDRMIEQMQRQSQEMVRQAQQMARQPATGAAPYVAAYGNVPAGQTSTTVVTISNNGKTCTRSTEVVSQGPGKPPKVTSNASGSCDGEAVQSTKPIDRT